MKYGRITNRYRYPMRRFPDDWQKWDRAGNLGDCMQSLGVENVYKKLFLKLNTPLDLITVHRDEIDCYDGMPVKLFMQSWFGDYAGVFPLPWSANISPVFLGFHLNDTNSTRERFKREQIHELMRPYQPIGCRDRSTRDFLQECGLDAYFSGCMTLTFDKRTSAPLPENGKIFVVDVTSCVANALPQDVMQKADHSITHYYYWNEYPVTEKGASEFEDAARCILNRYKNEALLVITSRIHVAMPCVALGIPVIFIHEAANEDIRFDVLQGILPLYTPDDIPYIDWKTIPNPVDIEDLKLAIIHNAHAQLTHSPAAKETQSALKQITDNLHPIPIKWLAEQKKHILLSYLRVFILSYLTFGKKREKYINKTHLYKALLHRSKQLR